MTLQNELYTLQGQTEEADCCSFRVRLLPESFIYKAHFPGQPITPGVCIIQIAKELLEEKAGRPLSVTAVKNVKFLSVIEPSADAMLVFTFSRIKEADEGLSASVVVKEDDAVKTKISFTCGAPKG